VPLPATPGCENPPPSAAKPGGGVPEPDGSGNRLPVVNDLETPAPETAGPNAAPLLLAVAARACCCRFITFTMLFTPREETAMAMSSSRHCSTSTCGEAALYLIDDYDKDYDDDAMTAIMMKMQ
jgi:hypothetical protein